MYFNIYFLLLFQLGCLSTFLVVGDNNAEQAINKKNNNEIRVECKTTGILCTTCKELSICIGDENMDGTINYRNIKISDCPDGQICVPGKGCRIPNRNGTFCPYGKFQCSDVGIYPDPYDCQVYHMCGPVQKEIRCTSGSFNSETNTCDYPMNTRACLARPVPLCEHEFQMGPLPDDLNKFYVCLPNYEEYTLSPTMFQCQNGLKFDIKTLSCS